LFRVCVAKRNGFPVGYLGKVEEFLTRNAGGGEASHTPTRLAKKRKWGQGSKFTSPHVGPVKKKRDQRLGDTLTIRKTYPPGRGMGLKQHVKNGNSGEEKRHAKET